MMAAGKVKQFLADLSKTDAETLADELSGIDSASPPIAGLKELPKGVIN